MLNVIDTTINIPGLKKPLTLLHITDLHLTRTDDRDSEYVNWLGTDRKNCFPNSEAIFDEVKKYVIDNPPDYSILAGDIIDFPSEKNLDTLYDFLNNDCKNYLYTLGNHDWCYPNQEPDHETQCRYFPRFYPITNGTPDFQVVDAGGVLLIGIDDTTNQITLSQLEKLKEVFKRNIPCILFFHIPIYISTLIEDVVKVWGQPLMIGTPKEAFSSQLHSSLIPSDSTNEFCRLIEKSDTPVKAIFCGHVHFSHEDSFSEGKIQYVTQLCSTQVNNIGTIRRIKIISD